MDGAHRRLTTSHSHEDGSAITITSMAPASTAAMNAANFMEDGSPLVDDHSVAVIRRLSAGQRRRRQCYAVVCVLILAAALASTGVFLFPYISRTTLPSSSSTGGGDGGDNGPGVIPAVPTDRSSGTEMSKVDFGPNDAHTAGQLWALMAVWNDTAFDSLVWYWDYPSGRFYARTNNAFLEIYDFHNNTYTIVDVRWPVSRKGYRTRHSDLLQVSSIPIASDHLLSVDGAIKVYAPVTEDLVWRMYGVWYRTDLPEIRYFMEAPNHVTDVSASNHDLWKMMTLCRDTGSRLTRVDSSCSPNYELGHMTCNASLFISRQ